jgi:hypothetical protein
MRKDGGGGSRFEVARLSSDYPDSFSGLGIQVNIHCAVIIHCEVIQSDGR